MAFGDIVNSAENSAASGAITVTFTAATAGNLLIFTIGRSAPLATGQTWGTPTGWNGLTNSSINTGNIGGAWYYKIAAGGETTVTSTESIPVGNVRGQVIEFEGPFEASPLDKTAEDETNLSTVVTSQSTGTTAATAQNDELAVGFWSADQASNVETGRAYTNSFTEVLWSSATNSARAACITARKVLSSTGAVECTFSTTDTGDEMYGAVATFKKQAAAGGRIFKLAGEGGGLAGVSKGLAA